MIKVVEKLLKQIVVREISGINSVIVASKKIKSEDTYYLQTEGVNFKVFKKFPFLKQENMRSNDIQTILKNLGVNILLILD